MEVHQSFERRLNNYGVTPAQWCILIALYDEQASSISTLSEYIEVDKASISRVVERLDLMQLITHLPGKDRRSGIITLTVKGKKLVPHLLQEAETNENQFFGHLIDHETTQLQHILRKILITIPSITRDGWLQNISESPMSDISTTIITILKEGKELQKLYPQIFEDLKNAGVTEYTVSWSSGYKGLYTGAFGTVNEPVPAGFIPVVIAHHCNLDAAKHALHEIQQKKINFIEWLTKMAAAGISHYHVDMKNRSITYYDPLEQEHFTEHIPTI